MADDQVKYSELVRNDNNNFQGLIDALNTVKAKINELREEGTRIRVSINGVSSATRDQQQALGQDAASAERLRNDLRQLTAEEARLKAAIAEANRMTKLQAQAEQAAAGSLNEMRAKYKLLVAEMGRYNLKTEEGRRKMQTTAAQARKLRDEIYKLEASYGQFGRNVGNYTGSLSRFSARLKEAAARFVAFNAAFLSATGLIRFGKALFEVRKELESTLVTYKALAGEIQGAKLFEEVKNFALTTPVTLNAASKAVQTMLSFGVAQEKVVDIMKRLGDISSADSERMQRLALAYSQATQAGRLMGQDTLQFINAGFNPLYYISLRTGESMEYLRDQMKKGKIDIQQVTQAIIDATSEGGQFNGMLEKQRDTMKGAAAIMEGAWQNMLNEMGSDMESGIVGIIKWLTKLMQNWRETLTTLRQLAVSFGTAKAALLLWKVAVEAGTKAVNAETVTMTVNNGTIKVNTAVTEEATRATWSWAGAVNGVKTAVKGLGTILKKFLPIAIISTITMVVQKLIDAQREVKRITDYTEDFASATVEMNEGARKEYMTLDKLFEKLRSAKKGTKEFLDAKQEIINNFGQYDSKLIKELEDVNNLDVAYQNLKTSIENSYKVRARETFMELSNSRLAEASKPVADLANKIMDYFYDERGVWHGWGEYAINNRNGEEYVALSDELWGKGNAPIDMTPKEVFDDLNKMLSVRSADELYDNSAFYRNLENYEYWGVDVKDIRNFVESVKNWERSQEQADRIWGEYQPVTETGYTPVTTGGGGDNDKKGKQPSAKTMTDRYWEAEKALLEAQYEGYELELKLAKLNRDKQRDELTNWYVDQRLALDENLKNGFITQEEYNARIIELNRQNTTLREGIDEQYWKNIRTLRSKNMKKMSEEWERNAKDNAKRELKAMSDGWQEQRAKLVEQGASRRTMIEEEVKAEIARLKTMLQLERTVNGEIMSDEEKTKVKEWIKLLEQIQAKGNYKGLKPGQIAGKGGANINTDRSNYSSAMQLIADVLDVDITSEQISALNSVFDQAKSALSSWVDARKEAADQAKQLADDEVSAAENALNREIELRNQGYANNVALRERELADAKKRQEEAAKLQQKAKKEELAANTAMEASSMAVAVANLFKQFPLYVAIPLTGVLLGAWGAAKMSALNSIKSTKYREGGVMLLEGGSHESGHDVNLGIGPDGSNLRAEGGEYFAVINKRSSRRYGSEIPNIVNALNSGMFEDRYIKTSDAMGMLPRIIKADDGSTVDLSAVESGVGALVKQGERTWSTEGEYRVMRYKNLTRRVRLS